MVQATTGTTTSPSAGGALMIYVQASNTFYYANCMTLMFLMLLAVGKSLYLAIPSFPRNFLSFIKLFTSPFLLRRTRAFESSYEQVRKECSHTLARRSKERREAHMIYLLTASWNRKKLYYLSFYNLITYSSQTDMPNISFSALVSFYIALFL